MAINSGYELTVYFNTGFNGVDIPADASVLETATKRTYNDTYFCREDIDKPVLAVNDTYANLRDADYVKLTPKTGNAGGVTSYYFCVPSAQAHNTTILALELDALLTMGGAKNLNYISGWQERGHIAKSDDDPFSNIASENFTPSRPLICRGKDFDLTPTSHASNDVVLVVSTVDLTEVANSDMQVDVVTGVDANDEEKMYFPEIKVNDDTHLTEFRTTTKWDDPNASPVNSIYKLPSTTAFLFNRTDVKRGLKALYSAGQLSLSNAYVIPKIYVDSAGVAVFSDKLSAVMNVYHQNEVIDTNTDDDFKFLFAIPNYTIKNKKVYSLYNDYQICNIASGASSIKPASELYDASNAPKIFVWSDTSPNGKPSARFSYIKDVANLFSDVVNGAPWYQQQLVFEGASGSLWNSINASFANAGYNRQIQQNNLERNYANQQYGVMSEQITFNQMMGATQNALSFARSGIGGLSDIMGGNVAGGLLNIGNSAIDSALSAESIRFNADMARRQLDLSNQNANARASLERQAINQSINENKVGLLKNNKIVSPTVLFTPSDTLSLFGQNLFKGYHITMDDDDIKELDAYFQRYGYNGIHRPLNASCFTCRQYYTYVQAFDINIKSTYGMRIRQKAINQLNNGVRVWRVLPDLQYYETN